MPLKPAAARNLASTTKTAPIWEGITRDGFSYFFPGSRSRPANTGVNRVEDPAQVSAEHKLAAKAT
jgi:hypothetical protein